MGVFVTCDKGKEKAALREVEDLLEPWLGREEGSGGGAEGYVDRYGEVTEEGGPKKLAGIVDGPAEGQGPGNRRSGESETVGEGEQARYEGTMNGDVVGQTGEEQVEAEDEGVNSTMTKGGEQRGASSIEDEIAAELEGMDGRRQEQGTAKRKGEVQSSSISGLGLITLDIPCVSFVRFPIAMKTDSGLNPTEIVLSMLRNAAEHPERQRSRFIKRLSPITRVSKILNKGLDEVCNQVLPRHFAVGQSDGKSNDTDNKVEEGHGNHAGKSEPYAKAESTGCRYKIDVTRRQSDHLSREEIIESVAGHVSRIGSGQHNVDLKTWEKLILVEVYRGIVGMSVIDIGYQEWEGKLKRGNLAEVYAMARGKIESEKEYKSGL